MSLKTENLAIVLTDIVGYTEATQNQSRLDNARLLATHNRILFPIIRRYKGRHVKSIGDALLLVFRSPTDAMLCAMAMQDALFEYNRNAPKDQQIHIRVAASLGEVRVTRNDVFGEAVNITSRIESITPADEVYLSEAVYMAMNKAEVPAQEVGWRELKGVSAPIRVFNIPRFATPRLVPQDVMAVEDMSDLVYPYGGAHLAAQGGDSRLLPFPGPRLRVALLAALVLAPLGLFAVMRAPAWLAGRSTPEASAAPVGEPQATARPATASGSATAAKPVAATAPRQYQPEFTLGKGAPPATTPAPAGQTYARISDAKRAYKEEKIGKDQYKRIVAGLEHQMSQEIDQARRDYKAEKIGKKEYRDRVEAIEKKYK
jgi:class 3 adenylate cyclase